LKALAFDSMDHFIARRRANGGGAVVELAHFGNAALKGACRALGVPSQIFFPYTTFMFELR
jgi:hypothetical protein